jgi:hypothetical protein
MSHPVVDQTAFVTVVRTIEQRSCARLLIGSIRSFGGALRHCPIWLFEADPQEAPCDDLEGMGVRVLPLTVPDTVSGYWFAGKVCACARAEELTDPRVRALIWLSPDCLIVKPPLSFDLAPSFDAVVRPVHIKNVGLLATGPVDDFWKKIYETVGVDDVQIRVESFVDAQHIRAYFNSHALAVNPSRGLFRRWVAPCPCWCRSELTPAAWWGSEFQGGWRVIRSAHLERPMCDWVHCPTAFHHEPHEWTNDTNFTEIY